MENKIRKQHKFILSTLIFLILTASSAAAEILVVAPHPDDDVIMASGVILRALQNGEPVKVVFMTNGDFGGIQAGYNRLAEAVAAQNQLGMDENDLLFLGYPDGGLDAIRTGFSSTGDQYVSVHGQSVTYGNRGQGRRDFHSYRFGAPANYNGANITLDLKTIIAEFLPEHIFTTSEHDVTSDHISTYLFVKMALAQLAVENPTYRPTVHKTIVWSHNSSTWPNAYDPTAYFSDAIDLNGTGLLWNDRESLDAPVSAQSTHYAGNPKYLAADAHYSQYGASSFLGRWIHKDEVFWVEPAAGGVDQPPVVAAGMDQSVAEGATVQLNGTGSFDKEGQALSYEWRQVEGIPVVLSSIYDAAPTFLAPAGLARDEVLAFELRVSDGVYRSYADAVNITVLSSATVPPVYTDITGSVTSVSASSVHTTSDVTNLVDGCIDGYPQDASCEWLSNGQRAGAWVQLNWDTAVTVGKVVLYDRINLNDQILQGTIAFSDGTTLAIGMLDNIGRGGEYSFAPRTITSLRYTVTNVSARTASIGLAEIKVFALASGSVPNLAPSARASAKQTVYEGDLVQLNGTSSSDPNGDALEYLWLQTNGPAVALSDALSANPTFTAPTGLSGDAVLRFELTVYDGSLDSQPAVVHVTVKRAIAAINVAPLATASASSQLRATYGAAKAIDGCTDGYPGDSTCEWIASYSAVKVGSWLQLTWPSARVIDRIVLYDRPNSNDQITSATIAFSDGSSRNIGPLNNDGSATEYTFDPVQTTSLRMTVNSVRGNVGLSEIQVFEPATTGVNRAPIAQASGPATAAENVLVQLTGSQSYDPDGDPITYRWSQTSGPAVLLSDTFAADPAFTTPSGLAADVSLGFALTVNDGQADSAAVPVSITVLAAQPANRAPAANAGADQTVSAGTQVVLNGSGSSDPDGDPLTYQWAQTGGLSVSLSDPTAAVPTFTAPSDLSADETLSFSLTVSDGQLSSTPSVVHVLVEMPAATGVNIAPLATATASSQVRAAYSADQAIDGCTDGYPGDSTCEWIASYTAVKVGAWLQLTWADPQTIDRVVLYDRPNTNDQITSATITMSDGSTLAVGPLNNNGAATEYTFAPVQVISLRLTVNSVRGNVGLSEIEVFNTVLSGGNRTPIAQVGGAQVVAENAFVQLNGFQSYDPDGDPLTYLWSQIAGPAVLLSDSTAADPTFRAPTGISSNTVLTFQLIVSDADLDSPPAQVNITVLATQPVNLAPVANAGSNQTVQQGDLVTLNGSASSDPNGDALFYQWAQTLGPSVTFSDASAAQPTFTAPSGTSGDQVLRFELIVNDGELSSTAASVEVTVQAPAGGANIAPQATATASSQAKTTYSAAEAIDGCTDGYPGDSTCEWIAKYTEPKVGAWLQLTWASPRVIDRIVLFDRPNSSDQITAATITLSDGSALTIGPLNNNGSATEYILPATETTFLRMTVNSVRGNVGLSEIQVFEARP